MVEKKILKAGINCEIVTGKSDKLIQQNILLVKPWIHY